MKFFSHLRGEPDVGTGEIDLSWIVGVIVVTNRRNPNKTDLDFILSVMYEVNPTLFEELHRKKLLQQLKFRFHVSDDPISEEGAFPEDLDWNEIGGNNSSFFIQDLGITFVESQENFHASITLITVFLSPIPRLRKLMIPLEQPIRPYIKK